jgi:hypothetical protein
VRDFTVHCRVIAIASSRDVSDPRTDLGVRVRDPQAGSLTPRLLFAPLGASAQTADDDVTRLAHLPTHKHFEAFELRGRDTRLQPSRSLPCADRYSLGDGEMGALGSSPPSPPPFTCVTALPICGQEALGDGVDRGDHGGETHLIAGTRSDLRASLITSGSATSTFDQITVWTPRMLRKIRVLVADVEQPFEYGNVFTREVVRGVERLRIWTMAIRDSSRQSRVA